MRSLSERGQTLIASIRQVLGASAVRWIALLGLCAAYLQGGFNKLTNFSGAIAEMRHIGLSPPAPMAVLVIALELGASALILIGIYRWVGALALAAFTLMATFIANRFWEMSPPESFMAANGFFEHIGGETFERSLKCLAKGGRLVTCGATAGGEATINIRLIFFKLLSILGSTMGSDAELQEIMRHIEAGRLRPVIDRVLPMDQIAEGHRVLENREAFGKVVLTL